MVSKDELKTLIEATTATRCVSLYMPTVRAGDETLQNPIRLKNELRVAEERLIQSGLRGKEARKLLDPVEHQVREGGFWEHPENGLALFCSSELLKIFFSPLCFEERVFVGNRFMIKPLIPLFSDGQSFYILALSQNQVRLLKGTRFHVVDVKLEGVPKNMAEALDLDNPQRQLQSHVFAGVPTGGSRPSMMFHGSGAGTEDKEEKGEILSYFLKIDRGLQKILAKENAPLVLAGVEYQHSIYREASSYLHLVTQGIHGNPDRLSAEELHRRAWEIVQPIFDQEMEDAKALYRQFLGEGTGKASRDVREIAPAAYYGRVGRLFLPEAQECWGNFSPDTGEVSLHLEDLPGPEDMDMLDFAAAYTFINEGQVYVLQPGQMPEPVPAAAVFRY